jgi:SAM-dependent methyltransferase
MNPLSENQCRLYGELAYLWPVVSPVEEYSQESEAWRKVLREKLGPGRHEILELGSGGGHLLFHLKNDFEVTAVDQSSQMLQNSMKLNPDVNHQIGDMKRVRLGRKFHAVIIHDSIDYLLSTSDVDATLTTVVTHLNSGGIFITAPQYRETFRNPHVHHGTHTFDGTVVTCVSYDYDPDPSDTTVNSLMYYFIKNGESLKVEVDCHTTGLFSQQDWLRHLSCSGFRAEYWPGCHGDTKAEDQLLVGTLVGNLHYK